MNSPVNPLRRLLAAALLCAAVTGGSGAAIAAEPLVTFQTDAQRERYDHLLQEYRCLKCQNQNLADSNAELAGDLRREIRARVLEGIDDAGIDNYLVSRYGDFVRYRPRFSGITLALWITPFALLAIGLLVGLRIARTASAGASVRSAAPDQAMDEARRLLSQKLPRNS